MVQRRSGSGLVRPRALEVRPKRGKAGERHPVQESHPVSRSTLGLAEFRTAAEPSRESRFPRADIVLVESMIHITERSLSPSLVAALLDCVHDRWFDLDELQFHEESGDFELRFGQTRVGPRESRLVVRGVRSYTVEDDAHIGRYDINTIDIDTQAGRVRLVSGFPLAVTLNVRDGWELECDPINELNP